MDMDTDTDRPACTFLCGFNGDGGTDTHHLGANTTEKRKEKVSDVCWIFIKSDRQNEGLCEVPILFIS